jgi:hypothetical protein
MADHRFTPEDLRQMETLGLTEEEVRRQVELFENPPPPIHLDRPATVGDGVQRIGSDHREALLARFERGMQQGRITKMVPASGAATRMFRSLRRWLEGNAGDEPPRIPTDTDPLPTLIRRLGDFAFAPDLAATVRRAGHDLETLRTRALAADAPDSERSREAARTLLELLLTDRGLGYVDLPKALIPFHRYPDGARTPFEEHLAEAVAYARDSEGRCRLHLTVPPEHDARFEELLATRGRALENRYGVTFDVGFSHQAHFTDTVAVTPVNELFRHDDGSLLFRPGGHGALIENLNALAHDGADVVFLKNIDNVVPEGRLPRVVAWKRLLGGVLLELRQRTRDLVKGLEADGAEGDAALLDEAQTFLEGALCHRLPPTRTVAPREERRRTLLDRLDRPLRVCGMVRNEGEPGGGPFWVRSPATGSRPGELSLQIVETSQIDTEDPEQREIAAAATHFNPVDLACSLTDPRGAPYDLHSFIDQTTVFISEKSHQGRPLKALERPGLWNGAMAGWNTVFLEVPLETFAPVKTVFDLLRPEHQG